MRQCQATRTAAVASILYALMLLSMGHARAGDGPQRFDIAPQTLGDALTTFAKQSQQQILFAPDLLVRKSSTGLQGTMRPLAALKILLEGSGLSFTSTPNGAILIGRPDSNPGARPNTAVDASTAVSEVIVSARREARRAQLTSRISAFVTEMTASAAGDDSPGLAQWHEPVCLLASGLSQEQSELLHRRISQIARAANVPLGGEHCRPNLYVYVAAQPEELLRGMEKRDFTNTFGAEALPAVVNNFIETPRAVRIWYRSSEKDSGGIPVSTGGGCMPPEGMLAVRVDCNVHADASRLLFHNSTEFSRILVIADKAQVQGVTPEQFADYVVMVGLARFNPDASLGSAPTILRLFDGRPQAAPAELTDWDEAYLRGLYATEPRSTLQRSQIARSMAREIAP